MSAQHTSRFIAPVLRFFVPDISPDAIRAVQFAVRKMAHVTEYGVLAFLLVRALQSGAQAMLWRNAGVTLLAAATLAGLDEYHQSFVSSRTGSPRDVAIDTCGALLGIAAFWWATSRRTLSPREAGVPSAADGVSK